MAVQRISQDPRTPAERLADEAVLSGVEAGQLLQVDPQVEQEAIVHVLDLRTKGKRAGGGSL